MKRLAACLLILFFLILASKPAHAIYDPLSVPNNKIGVHILSPDEVEQAAKLINSDGRGDWGYVTVPIQANDRDRVKWVRFMENCTKLKVIPIIRVATVVDGKHWDKPGDSDLIDFSNFLNDLPWPTQNHYVIIFNEVNRADEFGGFVSPENYTDILSNAINIFKQRSERFFILPAGLDNAAPTNTQFMSWKTYLTKMYQHDPEIFKRIDGWTSHAYGNPDFSVDPIRSGDNKADSFIYDLKFINQFTPKKLPVFITEAGWSNAKLNEQTVSNFYKYAFQKVWSNDQVVAVTPFLLFADAGPFTQFSLLNHDRRPFLAYTTIQSFSSKGGPVLEDYSTPTQEPLPTTYEIAANTKVLSATATQPNLITSIINFIKKIFHLNQFNKQITVAGRIYHIEVVTSQKDQEIGLAKYQSLEKDQGMLFPFSPARPVTFWMKNMKFDIDIVWIANNKVTGVSQGFFKDPEKIIPSPDTVDYVLEVLPGSNIHTGDTIKL